MIKVSECKSHARQNLLGRYSTVIGAQLISSCLTILVYMLAAAALCFALYYGNVIGHAPYDLKMVIICSLLFTLFLAGGTLLVLFFYYGQTKLFINILRGRKYSVGNIFYGFRHGAGTWTLVLTGLVKYALIYVCTLLTQVWGMLYRFRILFFDNGYIFDAVYIVGNIILFLITVYLACALFLCELIAVDRPEKGVLGSLKLSRSLMKGKKLKAFWFMYLSFLPWSLIGMICPFAMLWITPYIRCSQIVFYMAAEETLWQLPGSVQDEMNRKRAAAAAVTEAGSETGDIEAEAKVIETKTIASESEANDTEPEMSASEPEINTLEPEMNVSVNETDNSETLNEDACYGSEEASDNSTRLPKDDFKEDNEVTVSTDIIDKGENV
ncbi:MAG: DUF975 family protein [Lachnospiraceae bacterium]|nr:DUF975 family protein [Lachnospiraceae bacterium]